MRKGTKFVTAATALFVLANPDAAHSVIDAASGAFTTLRTQAEQVVASAGQGTPTATPASDGATPGVTSTEQAVAPAGRPSSYRFTEKDGAGRPARWNPCEPVDIIVNPRNAPSGALTDLKKAVNIVSQSSGVRFRIIGTTTAKPTTTWGTRQWAGRPGKWAPVLIAFGRPGTGVLDKQGGASGVTQSVYLPTGNREAIVSGTIVFNSDHTRRYRPGFGSSTSRGDLFLHELGHLAGLDHVNDPTQLMYPQLGHAKTLGRGDLAGLRKLGAGGCFPTPRPAWS